MFQLNEEEKKEVVANCDHLEKLRFSPVLPYAFTEHGALMVSTVLNSQQAIDMSLMIIRTFIKLRQMISTNKELLKKISELEKEYDENFKIVFTTLKKLMELPKEPKKQPIGFNTK